MVMSNGHYSTESSNGNFRANGLTENQPALLLNSQENEALFETIGSRCTSLASAVVQVLFADPSNPRRWRREMCGVACFVKDNPKKSFFIRILDIVDRLVLWEQELYHEMNYCQTLPYFHTFETDSRQAALNFANEDEASFFYAMVHEKVELLHRKNKDNQRRRAAANGGNVTSDGHLAVKSQSDINQRSPQRQDQNNNFAVSTAQSVQVPFPAASSDRTANRGSTTPAAAHSINNGDVGDRRSTSKKSKAKRITKQDIGLPSNFVHISHIGWDPDKGFDYDDSDPTLQELFRKAGIDMRKADAATRSFIYGFIEKELGGVNAVKKAVHPPPAPSQPPPPPRSQPRHNPPPIPTTPPQAPSRAPPRQARVAQPAAPPPPPPPPAPPSVPMTRGQAPVVLLNIPPPPPPPSTTLHTYMEKNDVNATEEVDSRTALMDSIRKGRELKKVEAPSVPQTTLSGRDKLMNDITSGVLLKHVDPEKTSLGKSDSTQQLDGMAAALARALANRRGALEFQDDSDDNKEEGSEDEDDWD